MWCLCSWCRRRHPRFSFITRFDTIVVIPRRLHILSYVLFVSLRSFMTNEKKEKRKKTDETWRIFCLGCTTLTRTQNLFFSSFFSLLWSAFWINFRQKLARTLVTTLASIITMSGKVGILTISTVRTTSFSRRCVLSSSFSASARCVRTNKTFYRCGVLRIHHHHHHHHRGENKEEGN